MTFADDLVAALPLTVADYMARCNAHYYATRDPLGTAGDFTTAPEISQMFGELIGAWLAERWVAAGVPEPARLVELGPGRGTMMTDMLRSMRAANWWPNVKLVETSPALRAVQSRCQPAAVHHDKLADVPDDAPLFLIANEFFDALPVRQIEQTPAGWRERIVVARGDGLSAAAGDCARSDVPEALAASPAGSIVELSPVATAIAAEIGARLARHGGAALIIDYGHAGPVTGNTLQAVHGHTSADPFAIPGEADLTAHVDFTALAVAARTNGAVRAWGPVGQGNFLRALGIDARAAALKRTATAGQAAAVDSAVARLTGANAMGSLFQVMALTPAAAAAPPGFA